MTTENRGWYGVDLDKTLAHYDTWKGELHIGAPIPGMVKKVKEHLIKGDRVKIFTARVAKDHVGNSTEVTEAIQDWTEEVFGVRLEVTNEKDYGMIALYEDRAIQMIPNTGVSLQELADDLLAKYNELRDQLDSV